MENMTIEKKKQGDKTYIKVTPDNTGIIVTYQLLMITGNQISNFVEVSRIQNNDEIALTYDITDMISLSEIIEKRKLRAQEFRALIETIVNTEKNARSYQLVNRGILINPDYIFFTKDQKGIKLMYLPFYNEDTDAAALRDLLKNLILDGKTENANNAFAMKLINTINGEDCSFSAYGKLFKTANNRSHKPNPAPKSIPVPVSAPKPNPGTMPGPGTMPNLGPKTVPPVGPSITNKAKKEKKKNESSLKNIVFILAVGAVVVILGLLYTSGVFIDNGSLKVEYIAGAVLAGGAALFVLYRELFVNHKNNEKEADVRAKKSKKQKSPQDIKSIPKPLPNSMPNTRNSYSVPQKPQVPVGAQQGGQSIRRSGNTNDSLNVLNEFERLESNKNYNVNESEETVLMEDQGGAYLEYSDHGIAERFNINSERVLVGRQKRSVQYSIPNNMVSKIHAEFGADINGYYVMDCSTPNGTYINDGERLEPQKKYYILDGDVIRLAKTELIFHC